MTPPNPPTLPDRLTGLSSMATRALLADLAVECRQHAGVDVVFEAVGGVDAARRVQAGEHFDLVVLASEAIDRLIAAGCLLADSKCDLVRSGVAIAVRAGARRPAIGTEDEVRQAVLQATRIGTSTGPSGVQLARLFDRWGIADAIRDRLVQAPPGVPVGALLARGEVDLGFQQLSELMHLDGIEVLGPLPAAIQIDTTFSAGIGVACTRPQAARRVLDCMASASAEPARRRHGMDSA